MATASNWREKLRQAEGQVRRQTPDQVRSETLAKSAITAKSLPSASADTLPKLSRGTFGINGSFGNDPENRKGQAEPVSPSPRNTAGTSQTGSPPSSGPSARSDAHSDSAESRVPLIHDPDAFEERAALIEYGAGVPREWAEGFAQLDLATPPKGFHERRWRTLIDDGGKFLDRWGGEAARLGWSELDVFGAHPIAPGARYDAAGLVTLINGGEVIAIRSDRATIRARLSPSELTYLRTPRAGVVALWDVSGSILTEI